MDGNRRWGKLNNISTFDSYKVGKDVLLSLIKECENKCIKCVSCYTFSTENFQRNEKDINAVFDVVISFFENLLIEGTDWKIIFTGNTKLLPVSLQKVIQKVENTTKDNNKIIINIALGYGSREEILTAANLSIVDNKIDRETFESNLYTSILPPLDLIIRTGGERRLSNFMLYQAAYAEIFFVDKLWCDFNVSQFNEILEKYITTQRNFGK